MTAFDKGFPPISEAASGGIGQPLRAPLKAVRCLLPVWGYRYVRQFLEIGLPTWLAPGNLPALAAAVPTEFVLLTSREDELYLRAHPAFRRLCEVCPVVVRHVDHLITGNNYSTTITLAYTEAVRAAGPALVDTCFFFLVSDYVVADGSFAAVLRRIAGGASGVLVGNFQVVEEEAMPWLAERLNASPKVLALDARQMMGWALSHLHPATIANTVNYPFSHNDHTNRLFWRADNQTLIGRFFLMHMIAIRPERADFIIGSACDYSFIPEMCPSDNVEIITDSDDYLVIEMQPRYHEAHFLKPGAQKAKALAATLSEWTTERHRRNAETTVVFHAGEIGDSVAATTRLADEFLAELRKRWRRKPRPHRNHPYWTGAVAAFNEASGAALAEAEWRLSLGLPNPDLAKGWLRNWAFERARFLLFGKPPHVRLVHPRWPDHSLVLETLRSLRLADDRRLLLIADAPTIFTATFADGGDRVVRLRTSHLVKQPLATYEPLFGAFDACLVEIGELEFAEIDDVLDRIAPLLKDDGTILVSIYSQRSTGQRGEIQKSVARHASRLIRPFSREVVFNFVTANGMRWGVFNLMTRIARTARDAPLLGMPALLLGGLPLALACATGNRMAKVRQGTMPQETISSILVAMKVDAERARETHRYSASRILRERRRVRPGAPQRETVPRRDDVGRAADISAILGGGRQAAGQAAGGRNTSRLDGQDMSIDAASEGGTREPQYNRCLDIREKQGLTSLGLMTNQVWEDDPRRLTFLLSRYKFVSKMLSGRKFVGELGCGDAFGTRIVLQEVEKVVAYDFDPVFIEDIRERQSERWPIEAHLHDIIEEKLPNLHDAIYSLDVIEHIPSVDEDKYLANLSASLTDNGVLIIGTPSLESQDYASPPSKAGHVNCKSGPELKALLGNYFDNVFLFSMNDEVVHTGFTPMAHYLFAVCSQKKKAR